MKPLEPASVYPQLISPQAMKTAQAIEQCVHELLENLDVVRRDDAKETQTMEAIARMVQLAINEFCEADDQQMVILGEQNGKVH
jgi:hypothetical protein